MAKTIKTTRPTYKKKINKDARKERRMAIANKRNGVVNIWR